MTSAARLTILLGISLFTAGTIIWILTGDWHWFAGGGAIFLGTIISGGVLSVEVKHPQRPIQPEVYREPEEDTGTGNPTNGKQETSEDSYQTRSTSFDLWAPDPEK